MPLRPEEMTRFGLRSLVYHETVLGHHFHIGLSVETRTRHAFVRFAPLVVLRPSLKDGPFTRLAAESVGLRETLKGYWSSWMLRLFAPGVWWPTPASTPGVLHMATVPLTMLEQIDAYIQKTGR
jgi:hypothetical protein